MAPAEALRDAGFDVATVPAALPAVAAGRPDLLVCDGVRDRKLLRQLLAAQSLFGDLPIIMLAPDADRQAVIAARLEGADDVLRPG